MDGCKNNYLNELSFLYAPIRLFLLKQVLQPA